MTSFNPNHSSERRTTMRRTAYCLFLTALFFWIAFATSDPASSALNFYWDGDKVASFQNNATTDYVHIFHVLTATSDSTDLTFLGFSDLGIIVLDDISVSGLSGSLTGLPAVSTRTFTR